MRRCSPLTAGDILKVNEKEMEVLTGYNDPEKAAIQLAEWGVKEVLITLGSLGSLIYAGGEFHRIPAFPPKEVVDATGCGLSLSKLFSLSHRMCISLFGWFTKSFHVIALFSVG